MVKTISKRVGLPVYADNNVNVACLAESMVEEAGKGLRLCTM